MSYRVMATPSSQIETVYKLGKNYVNIFFSELNFNKSQSILQKPENWQLCVCFQISFQPNFLSWYRIWDQDRSVMFVFSPLNCTVEVETKSLVFKSSSRLTNNPAVISAERKMYFRKVFSNVSLVSPFHISAKIIHVLRIEKHFSSLG